MKRKRKRGFRGLALAAGLALAGVLPACGAEEKAGVSGAGKEGGTITVAHTSFPDFLDPALSYTVDGWEAMWNVYTGLLTYKHVPGEAGAELQPGLAEALPDVSSDGKTYTLKLRDGLKFSDGTPVKASDFRHTIERILAQDSPGSGFFTGVAGAEKFQKAKSGHISGIEVDDETGEIAIELTEPRADFSNILAINFAGVVPSSTPLKKNVTKSPPPGTGPYTFESVKVNRGYTLVRNPNFTLEGTAADAGYVDRIEARIVRNQSNQATQVLQSKLDFLVDPPPADRLGEVRRKAADRFHPYVTASTYYFFMNVQTPPFDKLEVRQAVNYAIDKKATARLFGGLAEPASTVLPPGMPGYRKFDLYPGPDVEKAKQLIAEAGAEGAQVTVWTNPEDPARKLGEYYTDLLNSIGMKAKIKVVAAETYFQAIGNRSSAAQTGFTNWFQDYPHPGDFIDVLLNPKRVTDTANNNFSWNEDDKELATKIADLNREPDLQAVKDRWSDLDREVMEKAYWAPYAHRQLTTLVSDRLDLDNCPGEHFIYGGDFGNLCLK